MDDLEKAVLVLFSQDGSVSAQLRQEAQSYCDGVKARSQDAWQPCLERFFQVNSRLEVRFWCLQAGRVAIHVLSEPEFL